MVPNLRSVFASLGRTLAFACTFTLAPLAFAQKVLVLAPPTTDAPLFEAFGRLRAELALQNFEVIVLDDSGERMESEELELRAQSSGAFAAVSLQRRVDGSTAEICIVDRVTGKTTQRRLVIEASSDGPTVLAVRAVDLLRASLVELPPGERPPVDVVGVLEEPAPPEVVVFRAEPKLFQLRTGVEFLFHSEVGVGTGVGLAFDYSVHPRLRLGISAAGPLFGAAYRADGNLANVRQEFALARVALALGGRAGGAGFEWGPTLGLGVHHVEATGVVDLPLVTQSEDTFAFASSAGLLAQYFVSSVTSVALDVGALALIPQPVVAIGNASSPPLAVQGRAALSLGVSF